MSNRAISPGMTPQPGERRNPSGLSKTQYEARQWIRERLAEPETRRAAMDAYVELLKAKDPVIVKDYMDRIGGKPAQAVEVTGAEGGPLDVRGILAELGMTADDAQRFLREYRASQS